MKILTALSWNSSSKPHSLCHQTSVPFTICDTWKYFFSGLFKILCIIQLFFFPANSMLSGHGLSRSSQKSASLKRPKGWQELTETRLRPQTCLFRCSPACLWRCGVGNRPCGRFLQRGIDRAAARGPGVLSPAPWRGALPPAPGAAAAVQKAVAEPVLWLGAGWPLVSPPSLPEEQPRTPALYGSGPALLPQAQALGAGRALSPPKPFL